MSYRFAGFFAPGVAPPTTLAHGAVWREIAVPFIGVGLLLPGLIGKHVAVDTPRELVQTLGIDAARQWLFLQYDCWVGRIDSIYGLGSVDGEPFGPIAESRDEKVKQAYTDLMARLGVSAQDAMNFPPFARGFWGEAPYRPPIGRKGGGERRGGRLPPRAAPSERIADFHNSEARSILRHP